MSCNRVTYSFAFDDNPRTDKIVCFARIPHDIIHVSNLLEVLYVYIGH